MTTGRRESGAALRQWRVLAPVVVAALAGVVLAWILRRSGGFAWVAFARVLADCAGAVVIGLAALPRLNDRLTVAWRPLAVLAGVWFAAEFTVLVCEAAEIVGVAVTQLDASDFITFLGRLSGGQIGIAILFCTGAIACYAALAFRRPDTASADLVLVFAAVALSLRPITGHMSQQMFGSVLAAIHALAAACWLGLLLAMVLVLRTRGEWAATLPRYSAIAAPLVGVVALTGLVNGVVRLGGITALLTTGYGRILLAKLTVLCALVALGWWW
ncbi:CopD family protein, partial [Nocardia salmonicida]